LGCQDNYGYCTTNRLLREEARYGGREYFLALEVNSHNIFYKRWGIGQPNNANNNQHCVLVDVNETHALLDDENCEKKFRYICEVRIFYY